MILIGDQQLHRTRRGGLALGYLGARARDESGADSGAVTERERAEMLEIAQEASAQSAMAQGRTGGPAIQPMGFTSVLCDRTGPEIVEEICEARLSVLRTEHFWKAEQAAADKLKTDVVNVTKDRTQFETEVAAAQKDVAAALKARNSVALQEAKDALAHAQNNLTNARALVLDFSNKFSVQESRAKDMRQAYDSAVVRYAALTKAWWAAQGATDPGEGSTSGPQPTPPAATTSTNGGALSTTTATNGNGAAARAAAAAKAAAAADAATATAAKAAADAATAAAADAAKRAQEAAAAQALQTALDAAAKSAAAATQAAADLAQARLDAQRAQAQASADADEKIRVFLAKQAAEANARARAAEAEQNALEARQKAVEAQQKPAPIALLEENKKSSSNLMLLGLGAAVLVLLLRR